MGRTGLFNLVVGALKSANHANKMELTESSLSEFLDQASRAQLDRRQLLKGVAGVSLLASFPMACKPRQNSANDLKANKSSGSSDSVLILGAGLAGLSAAYSLSMSGVNCTILEGRKRLGGRVITMNNFNDDGQFCELGAELVDSAHSNLRWLASELDVEIEDFASFDKGFEPILYYFNNKLLLQKDLVAPFRPLAKLIDQDRKSITKGASAELNCPTYKNTFNLHKFDNMSIREYLDQKIAQGVEPWVANMIDSAYRGEYGLATDQQSAISLLVLVGTNKGKFSLFGNSDESKRVKGGNSRLTEGLSKALQDRVEIQLETKVIAIKDLNTSFVVTVEGPGGATKEFKASQIICTLPFTMLREVNGIDKLNISPVKKKCIAELGFGTLSKFMIGFKGRFWRASNGAIPASTGSIITDLRGRQFWESSRLQNGDRGIITNFLSADEGRRVSPNQLALSLADLSKVHGSDITGQHDGNKALMNWASDPFVKASYTSPKVGQYTTIWGAGAEPELNGRLLFAGEHTSTNWQGFMEGAIETGFDAAKFLLSNRKIKISKKSFPGNS